MLKFFFFGDIIKVCKKVIEYMKNKKKKQEDIY